ncbi:MAG: hypothetical protein J6P62_11630 [Bacteroidales bacterium]|nr:hypothetical protein [Bacteroidales bacterium]
MTRFIDILLYAWQLPQNLLGLLLVAILRPEDAYDYHGSKVYYSHRMRGGISLGRYIIIRSYQLNDGAKTERHELGHSMQSRMLGWLYLFVIGIPSILWAAWWNEGRNRSYYSFYTERWADRLGGVERDE